MSKNIYRKAVLFTTLLSFHTLSGCVNTMQQACSVQPIKRPIREELDSCLIEITTMSNSARIKNVSCALMTGFVMTTSIMLLMHGLGWAVNYCINYFFNRSHRNY